MTSITPADTHLKRCSRCHEYLLLSSFGKNKRLKDGLNCYCKPCHVAKTRAWQQANEEKHTAQRLAQYQLQATILRAKRNARYAKNRDAIMARAAQARKDNPERYRQQDRRFCDRHPAAVRAKNQARRAHQLGAEGKYTEEEWLSLCAGYDYRCACCGEQKRLTADHVQPLARGGSNFISNIQPLCCSCNASKGTKTIDYRQHG